MKMKMMGSGCISLLYKGEIIDHRKYDYTKERRDIIKSWELKYNRKWENMSLQINPETDILKIELDGTNIRYKHEKVRKAKSVPYG